MTYIRTNPIRVLRATLIFPLTAESDSNFASISVRIVVVTIEVKDRIIAVHKIFCLLQGRKA